jgi:hypothetical protein
LFAEIKRCSKRTLKVEDIEAAVRKTIDPFFRYQNEKLDAASTFFASEDKIFRFVMDGVPVEFYLPMAGSDKVQGDILRTSYFYQPKPLFFLRAEGLLKEGAVVVDAGANVGNHTVFFSKIMRAGMVHSFEPNPPAYSILSRNVELNGLQEVVQLHST